MTLDQVRALLLQKAEPYRGARGEGIKSWCMAHGINHQAPVSEFLRGKRPPPPNLLDALGLEWKIVRTRRAQSEDARKKGE